MDFFSHLFNFRIFQYLVCMARFDLLFCPLDYFCDKRDKRVLQPLLRQRAAVWTAGRPLWSFPQKRYTKMDEKQMVPVWISNILFCNVLPDALEHLSGIFRRSGFKAGCDIAVDLSGSMAVGLSRYTVPRRRSSVFLRFLQCNAYLHCTRSNYYGTVQAPQLVRLLPYGNNDTDDLQNKE